MQDNDQDNKNFSDEEYHFSEEDNEEVYPTEKPGAAQLANLFQGKKILTVLGVIVILYVSYKLLIYITKPKEPTTTTTPVVEVTPTPKSEPKPVVAALDQRYVAAIQSNQEKIRNIEGSLDNTSNVVYTILKDLKGIDNKINQLQSVFAEQIAQKQSATLRKQRNLQQEMNKVYQVYAVIPNRAWLQDKRGGLLTVTVGSSIPGAGRVTAINQVDGVVTTDKNISIFYQY
jgi:hypothetical protein